MPANNTINGKSFEYACLVAIKEKLEADGKPVSIQEDAPYLTTQRAYESKTGEEQEKLKKAAETATRLLFPLEPMLENGTGEVLLAVNADAAAQGVDGDVRDVICIRYDNGWEIGLSCKHNHEALKHPRITQDKDFGRDWVGYPCSEQFISDMTPIITPLVEMGNAGVKWREIEEKQERYYEPILRAYLEEIRRLCEAHADVPERLLRYFFGSRDFYKVIAKEKNEITTIEAFNMYGTLGQQAGRIRPMTRIHRLHLPTRLIEADFKPNSKTTIILIFDGGWTISMRLHNKDDIAKPTSLAWDVQLVGLPTNIYVNSHSWNER